MKIVVTGASGRIGRAIHVRLSREHDVVGFDRAPSSTADVVGDLDDAVLLRRVCDGADAIVHTAALHAPHVGLVADAQFERVNVDGTRRVLDAAVAANVPRFVFTSSTAVFGDAATPRERAGWVDEALAPQPVTIYHRTKLAAEALLRDAAGAGGPVVRILRMSRCFPEPAPLMAAYRLHRGIDARDVADAHALALADTAGPQATYVISGATPFLPDDADALLRDAPSVLRARCPELVEEFELRDWPLPASIDRVYDAALAMRELRWRPHYGFDEPLAMFDAGWSEVLPPRRGAWTANE
ncbi:NAD-dependent epimerase/dehydratase family protein [Tahibacter soli]|jgi:nucleoside-diphosphate-sugar epimerase|uniref:NAD(P)-dependent oxidoreductase n=1 Tax=Tahibacter soli TaxID=2983605 RepID=A0A9X4BM57_9GAMM|nr:NAD(P)-dependent oxidoreductase [Tahibacter soli]MDC8015987.1 NAD(P)-dependent oxidoreductase [Tahibacter soli]